MTGKKGCLNCKGILKRKKLKKFCSKECRWEYQRKNNPIRKCIFCGNNLSRAQKKYCSRKCRFDYERNNKEQFKDFYKKRSSFNIGKKRRKEKNIKCKNCGEYFLDRIYSNKKYCSRKCYNMGQENHAEGA